MAFNPQTYEALSEIQAALLQAESGHQESEEVLRSMRQGLDYLALFETTDQRALKTIAGRWTSGAPAPAQAAEDRRWVSDQIGQVITKWNERRREPWLED